MPAYASWQQVAGYFDGDGSISISDTSNRRYKLSLSLIYVDQSAERMLMLKDFLESHYVRTSNVLKTSKGTAHMIAVSRFGGVLGALKMTLPRLFKKYNEAQAAMGYMRGESRGTTSPPSSGKRSGLGGTRPCKG